MKLPCFSLPNEHKDIATSRAGGWIHHSHCDICCNSRINGVSTLSKNGDTGLCSEVVGTCNHTTSAEHRLFGEHCRRPPLLKQHRTASIVFLNYTIAFSERYAPA